ncbi:hypothetical protein C0J52_07697 [Blattella germanica]|nr:hypothetical protein C0J52_07697 [Blattella germanica]
MGGQKFQYDESGGTFFYFLLSFLALLLIPGTYYWWPRKRKQDPERSVKECQCEDCKKKKVLLQSNEPWKGTKQLFTKLLICFGWLILILLTYKVSQFDYEYANFDPYEILGVPLALTDDEARRNWEKYGNPDGPGAMSFGIALPSWIVEKENSFWVLLDTTQMYYYFFHKTPSMALKRVIMILAASLEFEKKHNSEIVERPTDNEEVPLLIKQIPNLSEKNRERPLCFMYSIKARALIHAHLNRIPLNPETLDKDRQYIVKKCPYLIQEMVNCVSQLILLAYARRMIDDENPTVYTAGAIVTVTVTLIRQNMSVLFGDETVTDKHEQQDTSNLHKEEEDEEGEKKEEQAKKPVWQKQRRGKKGGKKSSRNQKPVGRAITQKKNEEKSQQSGDTNQVDDDDDTEWEKFQTRLSKREKVLEGRSKQSHSVHCPFYPEDKQEYWWVYISDRKSRTLLTSPYHVTALVEEEEVQLKFTAPRWPGVYTFTVCLRCDSYFGFDQTHDIKLDVKEAPEVPTEHPQWEMVDDEEEEQEGENSDISEFTTDEDVEDDQD